MPNAEEMAIREMEFSATMETSCGICLECPAAKGKRLGLLLGCNHAFCLDCIRVWRATSDQGKDVVRICPVCRLPSDFVVPCDRLVVDPGRKDALVAAYKANCADIPCKYFNFGHGRCPFGTSCWYAHVTADGTPADQRLVVDEDGEIGVYKKASLLDFVKPGKKKKKKRKKRR